MNYKVLATVVVTAACMFWVKGFVDKVKRIGPADKLIEQKQNDEVIAAPQAPPSQPVAEPSPVAAPAQPAENLPSIPSIAAIPVSSPEPVVEVRRAEAVIPSAPEPPAVVTPSTTSTDAQNQRSRKSRTH